MVAVHCKSGLGRTGTLIGLYLMKIYKMKARDYIGKSKSFNISGYCRIIRPGSIHGDQ